MLKIYLQSKKDTKIDASFYYDQKLIIGTDVLHNNVLHTVVHCRDVSELYTTEQIKEKFLKILNKTYHGCSESEMDYILYALDKETLECSEELNKEESQIRNVYDPEQ